MKWDKKDISQEMVKEISAKFGCDLLTASILARRGINTPEAIRFFLEDDLLSLRNPFALDGVEDAVERILAAKEEGEKVLVFGDSDVDGITATAILAGFLEKIGMDVIWRIPTADDAYGLSMKAVEDFAAKDGTLIITVDCGISRFAEVKRANELSIDVIVTDHHEPQDELPEALVIINPKLKNSTYPFRNLAGCGVAFKLVCALRFALKSELYGQEICLLNTRPANDAWIIEVAKTRNLIVTDILTEVIVPGRIAISDTRLPVFLQGQQILCWDAALHKQTFVKLFGKSIEIAMMDIAPQIGKMIPQAADQSLLRIKELSRIAKYSEKELGELDVFVNLFVSFAKLCAKNTADTEAENADIQLAALGTIADIMPLLDENRIIARRGIDVLKKNPHPGLLQLLRELGLTGRFEAKDISWKICPAINAARRMGNAQIAANLFFEKNPKEREGFAKELASMNENRKELEEDTWNIIKDKAFKSFDDYKNKLTIVFGEDIPKGVTGLMAQRAVRCFNVPSIAISINDNICTGSVRSVKSYNIQPMLEQCGNFFIDAGGHKAAGGFSLKLEYLDAFLDRLKDIAETIEFDDELQEETIHVDAELPHDFISPDILKLIDMFEPYGCDNEPLTFIAKKLTIKEVNFIGKPESKHLKLTLDTGKYKWPALYWQSADRFTNKEFDVNDKVDIAFNITRDYFKGNETPQIMILDLKR
ncbi:MAG: single-stranded-DNA-specific exonuclease RecJ [Treponema sp.]|nr:single-stranded-DNA-specific exonuclease RecJ [Treponema sp.]